MSEEIKLIPLTQGYTAIVDADMESQINKCKWQLLRTDSKTRFYAKTSIRIGHGNQLHFSMHQFVVGRPVGRYYIDHINGNGLDNRRSNLRFVSPRENQWNRVENRNGKIPGIKMIGKNWRADIHVEKKFIYLGTFDTKQEASAAYLGACKLLDEIERRMKEAMSHKGDK